MSVQGKITATANSEPPSSFTTTTTVPKGNSGNNASAASTNKADRLTCRTCGKRFATRKALMVNHLMANDGWCPTIAASMRVLPLAGAKTRGGAAVAPLPPRLQCHVLAHHFCISNDANTQAPGRFVRSLAAQIAASTVLRAARSVMHGRDVERALAEHHCNADPDSALENGVLKPLRSLALREDKKDFSAERRHAHRLVGAKKIHSPSLFGKPYIIFVDGLDECDGLAVSSWKRRGEDDAGAGASRSRRGRSRSIPELLARAIGKFPPWLTLVATSRPDLEVEKLMAMGAGRSTRSSGAPMLVKINLTSVPDGGAGSMDTGGGGGGGGGGGDAACASTASKGDVGVFVRARLAPMWSRLNVVSSQQRDALANQLCNHADGNFLFASLVLDELEQGSLSLDAVLASAGNNTTGGNGGVLGVLGPPALRRQRSQLDALGGLYLRNFRRSFPYHEAFASFESPVQALMGVLVAGMLPPTREDLRNTIRNVDAALASARPYLRRSGGSISDDDSTQTQQYRLAHRSLTHWLVSADSGLFRCSPVHGHALLASSLLRQVYALGSSVDFDLLPSAAGGTETESVGGSRSSSSSSSSNNNINSLARSDGAKLLADIRAWLGEDRAAFLPEAVQVRELKREQGRRRQANMAHLVYRCAWQLATTSAAAAAAPRASSAVVVGLMRSACRNGKRNWINAADPNGRTAVFLACQADGSARVLELLLAAGASPTCLVVPAMVSPLHIAARRDDPSVMQALLVPGRAKTRDVRARCRKGKTPLMCAARRGNLDVVRLLLSKGGEPLAADAAGRSALDVALAAGHLEIAAELRAAEAAGWGGGGGRAVVPVRSQSAPQFSSVSLSNIRSLAVERQGTGVSAPHGALASTGLWTGLGFGVMLGACLGVGPHGLRLRRDATAVEGRGYGLFIAVVQVAVAMLVCVAWANRCGCGKRTWSKAASASKSSLAGTDAPLQENQRAVSAPVVVTPAPLLRSSSRKSRIQGKLNRWASTEQRRSNNDEQRAQRSSKSQSVVGSKPGDAVNGSCGGDGGRRVGSGADEVAAVAAAVEAALDLPPEDEAQIARELGWYAAGAHSDAKGPPLVVSTLDKGRLVFPTSLSSKGRKRVHELARGLSLQSRSKKSVTDAKGTGLFVAGQRYVVVSRRPRGRGSPSVAPSPLASPMMSPVGKFGAAMAIAYPPPLSIGSSAATTAKEEKERRKHEQYVFVEDFLNIVGGLGGGSEGNTEAGTAAAAAAAEGAAARRGEGGAGGDSSSSAAAAAVAARKQAYTQRKRAIKAAVRLYRRHIAGIGEERE